MSSRLANLNHRRGRAPDVYSTQAEQARSTRRARMGTPDINIPVNVPINYRINRDGVGEYLVYTETGELQWVQDSRPVAYWEKITRENCLQYGLIKPSPLPNTPKPLPPPGTPMDYTFNDEGDGVVYFTKPGGGGYWQVSPEPYEHWQLIIQANRARYHF